MAVPTALASAPLSAAVAPAVSAAMTRSAPTRLPGSTPAPARAWPPAGRGARAAVAACRPAGVAAMARVANAAASAPAATPPPPPHTGHWTWAWAWPLKLPFRYSTADGGYEAVCWTDLVQGLLMLAVMLGLPVVALIKAGGISPVMSALQAAHIDKFLIGSGGPTIGFALSYFGYFLGYPGIPHVLIRYITIRDQHQARIASLVSAGYGVLFLFAAPTLGIICRALIPEIADTEKLLPVFAGQFLPPLLGGIILAAVSAAMMSTADSQLMLASTTLVHDLWAKSIHKDEHIDSAKMKQLTRMAIVALTVVAGLAALADVHVINTVIRFAFGCLGAAFTPVILMCLYKPSYSWRPAFATMIVGPCIVIAWQVLMPSIAPTLAGINAIIPGTLAGALVSLAL